MRPARAVNATTISVRTEPRDIPAVVDMRVCQKDGIETSWDHGQRRPVPFSHRLHTLEEATIHEDFRGFGLHQVLRTRNCARCSQKRYSRQARPPLAAPCRAMSRTGLRVRPKLVTRSVGQSAHARIAHRGSLSAGAEADYTLVQDGPAVPDESSVHPARRRAGHP